MVGLLDGIFTRPAIHIVTRLEVEGAEHLERLDGPVLICPNHTSHLDALVIWASLPPSIREITRPVAAKDYWSRGIVRRWLSRDVFDALLIDRTDIKVHQSPVDLMLRDDREDLVEPFLAVEADAHLDGEEPRDLLPHGAEEFIDLGRVAQ